MADYLYLPFNSSAPITISTYICYIQLFTIKVCPSSSPARWNGLAQRSRTHGSPEGVVVTWEWFDFFAAKFQTLKFFEIGSHFPGLNFRGLREKYVMDLKSLNGFGNVRISTSQRYVTWTCSSKMKCNI